MELLSFFKKLKSEGLQCIYSPFNDAYHVFQTPMDYKFDAEHDTMTMSTTYAVVTEYAVASLEECDLPELILEIKLYLLF
jgi:hypothetical protein